YSGCCAAHGAHRGRAYDCLPHDRVLLHGGVRARAVLIWRKIRLTLEMIKFEHSVFALPFALTGALLAIRDGGLQVPGLWRKLFWTVIAMVGARSAAMAFKRLVDSDIDVRNPRTRLRHIPAGLLSAGFGWGFVVVSSLTFILAARELNVLCFRLAPVALG